MEQGTFRIDPVTPAPTAPVIAANGELIAAGDTEQTHDLSNTRAHGQRSGGGVLMPVLGWSAVVMAG
jgi:hypothetical protein